MGILKRNPDKTLSPEMGYWKYLLFEYFGAYDDGNLETRLKALQVGWLIFSREGKAAYEFAEFHKNKRRVLGDVLKYLYVIIGLGGFVILLYVFNAPFFFALLAFVPPIIIHLLAYKPRLKRNLRHVAHILENSQRFTQLINLPVGDQVELRAFIESLKIGSKDAGEKRNRNDDAYETVFGVPISDFQMQLREISKRENQFNQMPMREVIDFFNVMCCPACIQEVPQMSEADFLLFLRSAFLLHPLPKKIVLKNKKPVITRMIFHQFMLASYDRHHDKKDIPKYTTLLCDHFEGFEFEKTIRNFRTDDNQLLERIRNDYKSHLHFLRYLQSS